MGKFIFIIALFVVGLFLLFKALEIVEAYARELLATGATVLTEHPEVVLSTGLGVATIVALVAAWGHGALTTRSCIVCGAFGDSGEKRFCGRCGSSTSLWHTVLGSVPAAASGLVVALICVAAGDFVPELGEGDFVGRILSIVRRSTVPVLDMAGGFIGGVVAVAALPGRSVRATAAVGLGTGALYAGGLAVVISIAAVGPLNGSRLAIIAALAALGAADAYACLASPGVAALHASFGSRVRGGWRYPVLVFAALVAIVTTFALYALILGMIVVAFVIAGLVLFYFGIRLIIFFLKSASSDDDEIVESRERDGLFGKYREFTNARGEIIAESRERDGLFGKYTETTNTDGEVVAESRERDGLFGKYTETTNTDGEVVAESRERDGLFGKYTETTNTDGEVVAESRERDGLFGKYVEHKRRS